MEWRTADAAEMQTFIRDHLIPRIDKLEAELILLRTVCWPVCQAFTENGNQLSDIKGKSVYMSQLHRADRRDLISRKSFMIRKLNLGAGNCPVEEESRITRTIEAPPLPPGVSGYRHMTASHAR